MLWSGALLVAGALAGTQPLQAQFPGSYSGLGAPVSARIWVDQEPSYFQRGDRMNLRFSVTDDSYVAVVHIDTDGNLDFLYPSSPWDNEFVRGGRSYSLPARGAASGWTVRGRSGIGYFYIIASPTPFDFGSFRGTGRGAWDWGYAGRTIRGDPFLAFEQVTRLLLPRWPYAPYVVDYYGYHVGGIHRYPAYACSDSYFGTATSWGWGWTPAFGTCSRMDLFLRQQPFYYDTRRYRGDRRAVLRPYDRLDPRHGFKEAPDRPRQGVGPGEPRPNLRGDGPAGGGSGGGVERRDPPSAAPDRRAVPESSGPASDRRPEPRSDAPATNRAPQSGGTDRRERPNPSSTPATSGGSSAPAPSGSGGSASPSRRPSP
jgi:hypothetical protein